MSDLVDEIKKEGGDANSTPTGSNLSIVHVFADSPMEWNLAVPSGGAYRQLMH